MDIEFGFQPRDIWIGLLWWIERLEPLRWLHIDVCLLPMFPLHLTIDISPKSNAAATKAKAGK